MKKNSFAALLVLVMLPFLGISQNSELGNWIIVFGNKQLNSKWNLHAEVQYRNYDAIGDLEQLLLRTGIGYNLTENNNNLLLGYGYIKSENYIGQTDDKINVNEHRIFQQFITKQHQNRLNITHRYRFEQRFLEDDFKMRLRYFLSLNYPLNHKNLEDKTWYLSSYNELFINTQKDLFDRNRIYFGTGYKLNNAVKFELGWMNQIFSSGSRDQINMIAFINF